MNIFMRGGEGGEALEIDVLDFVGYDYFYGGVSTQSVRRLLKSQPNVSLIKVTINSEGGDAFEGFAIYNLLKDHKARVEVEIVGLAASAASIIAMAGDEIRIAQNGWMMIHNASGCICGEGEDLKSWGEVLIKISEQAAEIYAARTGLDKAKCQEMLDATTWMNATQAKELGFVDSIVPLKTGKGRQPAQQRSSMSMAASQRSYAFMRTDHENMPEPLRLIVEAERAAHRAQHPRASQAPQQQLFPDPGGPAEPQTGEETNMSEVTLAAFLATAGIANATDLNARLALVTRMEGVLGKTGSDAFAALEAMRNDHSATKASLAKFEGLTGKTGEAALGVVMSWKESADELVEAQAALAKLQDEKNEGDLAAALEKAKAESRHTKAREDKVRDMLAKKTLNHEGALAFVEEWGVVAAIQGSREPKQSGTGTGTGTSGATGMTFEGKKFEELKPAALARLKNTDPDLFDQMEEDYEERKKQK